MNTDLTITVSIGWLFDNHKWIDFCMLTGYDEWAVNEGLASIEDTVSVAFTDAVTLGIVRAP